MVKNDFKHKVDVLLWAFIWLLPFFAFFVSWYRIGEAPALFAFIDEQYSFYWIKNVIDVIWTRLFGIAMPLSGYISYLVSVELFHCLFDVLAFVPRFAHNFVERSGHLFCKREK